MGRIFILEGPDGAGKSTLAEELRRSFTDSTYVHTGIPIPGEDVLHSYALTLWRASTRPSPTIIDRLHLGESVYGPIYRGIDTLGVEGQTILSRMISGYGAMEIICLPPFDVALRNWTASHAHTTGDEQKYQQVYEAYHTLTLSRGLKYDYTQSPNVEYEILNAPYTPMYDGVIGSKTPKFLFIADKANHPDLDAPFVSLSGSSHYLYECLHDAGFLESEMAFINSYTIQGKKVDTVFAWTDLGRPTAICLGTKAAILFRRELQNKTVPFWSIPHPAFWLRFRRKERDLYVKQLQTIRDSVNVHSQK